MENEKMVSAEEITVSSISSEGSRPGGVYLNGGEGIIHVIGNMDYAEQLKGDGGKGCNGPIAYANCGDGIVHIVGNMDYAECDGPVVDFKKMQRAIGFQSRVNAARNKFMDDLIEFVKAMNAIIKEATSCDFESDSE